MDTVSTTRPLLLTVPEAREALGGIGHTTFYAEVKAGRLRTVKIGARTLVAEAELVRYVAELSA